MVQGMGYIAKLTRSRNVLLDRKSYSVYAGASPRESDTGICSIIYHTRTFGSGPSGHAGV